MSGFLNSQIQSIIPENEWVSSFIFKPVPEPFLSRKAGQYLLLKLPAETGWSAAHPFTITSAVDDDFLQISVKRIGPFTTELHGVHPPVEVQVSGPMGKYGARIENLKNQMVFIAGGIGITPFISLLSHLSTIRSNAEITLFWANNRIDEFFHLDFFHQMTERLNLTVILAASDAQDGPMPGKDDLFMKQGLLTAKTLAQFISSDPDAEFFMCGSENMQKYLFTQLETLGVQKENVEIEKFGV